MIDKNKFSRVCGLLSSDFDGERAAAALLATRMLKDAGLTWSDLFSVVIAQDNPKAAGNATRTARRGDCVASKVVEKCAKLIIRCASAWDADYIINLDEMRHRFKGALTLTDKQWTQLLRIAGELGVVK